MSISLEIPARSKARNTHAGGYFFQYSPALFKDRKMKKIILLVLVVCSIASSQMYYPQFTMDSVRFVRPANATEYTGGDIIADSGSHYKYFTFSNIGEGLANARGIIRNVAVSFDTSDADNDSITVRFFSLSDTTGIWAKFPVDNAAIQSLFQSPAGKYVWLGDVTITPATFGTAAGGSLSTDGISTVDLRYKLLNGYLYCVVIAKGTFTPKHLGTVRVFVWADKQR